MRFCRHHLALTGAMTMLLALAACQPPRYLPNEATASYPWELHRPHSTDVQVFRDGSWIVLVNATATSYSDFDLWINQQFVRHVDELPAGGSVTLSLWSFRNDLGEVFNAGGLFRTERPTPLRMAQIQLDDQEPLVGLISITTGE